MKLSTFALAAAMLAAPAAHADQYFTPEQETALRATFHQCYNHLRAANALQARYPNITMDEAMYVMSNMGADADDAGSVGGIVSILTLGATQEEAMEICVDVLSSKKG